MGNTSGIVVGWGAGKAGNSCGIGISFGVGNRCRAGKSCRVGKAGNSCGIGISFGVGNRCRAGNSCRVVIGVCIIDVLHPAKQDGAIVATCDSP